MQNYSCTTWIFGVNNEGEQQWSYSSPFEELRDAANDMILLNDGSLLVASGVGTEIDWPSVNDIYFEKYLMKLGASNNLEWEIEFPGQYPSSFTKTSNIILIDEEDEFLASGTSTYVYPTEDSSTIRGWLYKGTTSGDSIWSREYVFLNNQMNSHVIYDLKETKDNGFVIAGESHDRTYQDSIHQQAWLLKVDEYGCLIPGCHLVKTKEVQNQEIKLVIYPNPTVDYLNFYLDSNSGKIRDGKIQITDLSGKMIGLFKYDSPGTTFILPVTDYPSGKYVLQYIEEGVLKASKIFIIL